MKRRDFLAAAAAAAPLAGASLAAAPAIHAGPRLTSADAPFKLAYAPHGGMFQNLAGGDVVDQIAFAHDQGFRAWEDNGMAGRDVAEQERIARALADRGMQMGVFVANFGTAFGKRSFSTASPEHVESFLADLQVSVECAARVNATWMTIVLGDLEPRLERDFQHANAIEMLKRGAEIFEPHGLVMVMEPLNPWSDHPGMLLSKISQAYMLCKAVGSPAVKTLFDIYHQQITEGNLIPNIRKAWDEIAYFQIGDNPGRNEPGTGEINYRIVFKEIHARGYTGVLGMEHGISRGGAEGEQALIQAYRHADDF
ncbi:hydroxypyruvate isomerase family protein [Engelhardtia mirabilis]|uniref:Hydroxypyruvate isomerase n=1 Tax=Engelhardtia mirabilis TaxID=2528011 RepID=A0A518BEY3_9BACT|nr:Hydroxypyruvate isomerase [Planctomycetes bacterium Pla133]QDU99871.1 Hydroxypyruvate isomerase [Planctomycetes bacterium Pla86]